MKAQSFTCPECSSTQSTTTDHGITCMSCGLVVKESKQYVVSQPLGRDGTIKTHKIITRGVTRIGLCKERMTEKFKRLSSIQSKSLCYYDKKKSKIYAEVSRLVSCLDLPESLVHETLHVYSRIEDNIHAGSSMANIQILATGLLFLTSKMRGCTVFFSSLVEASNIHAKRFRQNMLKLSRIVKEKFPKLKDKNVRKKDQLVNACMVLLRDAGGPDECKNIVEAVHAFAASSLVGMKQRSKLGVVTFISARLLDIDASLTEIGDKVDYRPSSLYNAIMRVLEKKGLERPKGLGDFDFKKLVLAGKGDKDSGLEKGKPSKEVRERDDNQSASKELPENAGYEHPPLEKMEYPSLKDVSGYNPCSVYATINRALGKNEFKAGITSRKRDFTWFFHEDIPGLGPPADHERYKASKEPASASG